MISQFRKKPVVIEALQWDGEIPSSNELVKWGAGNIMWHFNQNYLSINTLEGSMSVSKGDWVIKGIKGEFYPCKPDIFEKTYEKVEETPDLCKDCDPIENPLCDRCVGS